VLEEYRPGIFGYRFKLLAKRFKIKTGHKLIMRWYCQWDGTIGSLNKKSKGFRACTMTRQEVKYYILEFIEFMHNEHSPVNYKMIQAHIESILKRKIPIRTIRRYGKECDMKWKKPLE